MQNVSALDGSICRSLVTESYFFRGTTIRRGQLVQFQSSLVLWSVPKDETALFDGIPFRNKTQANRLICIHGMFSRPWTHTQTHTRFNLPKDLANQFFLSFLSFLCSGCVYLYAPCLPYQVNNPMSLAGRVVAMCCCVTLAQKCICYA